MGGDDIRWGDMRRLEQSMKTGNEIARSARHGHRGTPAQMTRVKKSSRAVIGTNPRKFGNLWNHSAHSGLKGGAPNFGIIPVPGLENHGGTTRATALDIHLA